MLWQWSHSPKLQGTQIHLVIWRNWKIKIYLYSTFKEILQIDSLRMWSYGNKIVHSISKLSILILSVYSSVLYVFTIMSLTPGTLKGTQQGLSIWKTIHGWFHRQILTHREPKALQIRWLRGVSAQICFQLRLSSPKSHTDPRGLPQAHQSRYLGLKNQGTERLNHSWAGDPHSTLSPQQTQAQGGATMRPKAKMGSSLCLATRLVANWPPSPQWLTSGLE